MKGGDHSKNNIFDLKIFLWNSAQNNNDLIIIICILIRQLTQFTDFFNAWLSCFKWILLILYRIMSFKRKTSGHWNYFEAMTFTKSLSKKWRAVHCLFWNTEYYFQGENVYLYLTVKYMSMKSFSLFSNFKSVSYEWNIGFLEHNPTHLFSSTWIRPVFQMLGTKLLKWAHTLLKIRFR